MVVPFLIKLFETVMASEDTLRGSTSPCDPVATKDVPLRIFWLAAETCDSHGCAVTLNYKEEDSVNIPLEQANGVNPAISDRDRHPLPQKHPVR